MNFSFSCGSRPRYSSPRGPPDWSRSELMGFVTELRPDARSRRHTLSGHPESISATTLVAGGLGKLSSFARLTVIMIKHANKARGTTCKDPWAVGNGLLSCSWPTLQYPLSVWMAKVSARMFEYRVLVPFLLSLLSLLKVCGLGTSPRFAWFVEILVLVGLFCMLSEVNSKRLPRCLVGLGFMAFEARSSMSPLV